MPNAHFIRNQRQGLVNMWLRGNDFNTLKLELKFLSTFLEYTADRCFGYGNMKNLLIFAKAVDRGAMNLDTKIRQRANMETNLMDEGQSLRSQVIEVHKIVLTSSESRLYMSNERVLNFIDSLSENLKNLVIFKVDLVDPLKTELKSLEEKLRLLRTFLMFTEKRCTEHGKLNDLFSFAKVAADNAAYLSYSCLVKEKDEDMLYKLVADLSDLVLTVDPVTPEVRHIYTAVLKASSLESSGPDVLTSKRDEISVDFVESLLKMLVELLRVGLIVPMRDKIMILQQELAFLRAFLMDPPNKYADTEALSDLLARIIILSTKAGSVVYSLYDKQMNQETSEKVYSILDDLLAETNFIKAEITKIYLEVPKSPSPKFYGPNDPGYFDGFLGNLRHLLNNRTDSVTSLNLPIEQLVEELQFLGSFQSKIVTQHPDQEKMKVLWTQITNVAYKAEYIIDSLLVRNGPIWHRMLWLDEVRKEIEVFKSEVIKIGEKKMHDSDVHHDQHVEISSQASSHATSPEMDGVVVGFEDDEESIVYDLAGGSAKLQMISIVGMPGLGKTQLAKKIYNNPTVNFYFDVRAWCYVSQEYNKEHLFSQILSQVAEPFKKMSEMTETELAAALYRSLKGKRYFILMDDLWDVEAWDSLRRSFPDDRNRSRIMFTSRSHNLNLIASGSKIHHLHPLTDDESWQLLQEKVFHRKSCPQELEEVGQQIASNCKGLPLTVVVVAGILERIGEKLQRWREVMESQSSYIVDDPDKRPIKVIELSYKHLPDYLKPCFLYIGALFKNKFIPIRKLICLWIAEGFVQKVEHMSLENIAKDYINDLIGRSLLIIEKRRSTGDIKMCRVHDLIRDFCVEKAKEENFFQLIERLPTSDSSRYIICEQRRISCDQPGRFLEAVVNSPYVRSLLFFGPSYLCSARGFEVPSICDKFKLLRVLDLACIMVRGTFPDVINLLFHLRYLAMCGKFGFIPSSIGELKNLETFILKGSTYIVHLPITIWNMVKLRHLHIQVNAFLSQPSGDLVSGLDNLQKFSNLLLSYGDGSVKLMEGLANLKSLKCIVLESWDSLENCNRLPVLATLGQLESLTVSYQGEPRHPYVFSFPSTIKRLTMSEFHLPWEQISVIGNLPNLEVLELLSKAFQGGNWDMGDGEFKKLKFLQLEQLDISKWSVSSDLFPPLEQLVLQGCAKLKEIPSCLGGIATLTMIKVIECRPCLEEVVNQIEEEQRDMGNEDLKVVIKPYA